MFLIERGSNLMHWHLLLRPIEQDINIKLTIRRSGNVVYSLTYAISTSREERRQKTQ